VSEVLVEARAVSVEYRRAGFGARSSLRALDGVSLQVERGEVVAVVGSSGAGKSTLARAILGLERVTSGSVAWSPSGSAAPIDIRTLSPGALRALRPRFQLVFQDPSASLDPRWTVRAILREASRLSAQVSSRLSAQNSSRVSAQDGTRPRATHAESREADALELLERVGLGRAHLDRAPHALSGGEAQRVCLARALAMQPDLLVLDEPVAALDASIQAQVLDLLQELRRERGLAFLLIAHDMALVEWMADRVLVLDGGRIVEEGEPDVVLGAPRHAATRALISAR
jgi:ABC-type glutathione transport system ATPase component